MNTKEYPKSAKVLIVLGLTLSMVALSGLAMARSASQTQTLHQAQSADPVTLNMSFGTDPPTLDPALATDTTSIWAVEQLFLGLTGFNDETMDVVPELATSWDTSPDGQVYTFTLRSDAYWTDGHPVTAHDVEYGVKRTLDPTTGSAYAYVLYIVENAYEFNMGQITDPDQVGVQAVGDYTLVFTLTHPAGYFPAIAGMWVASPQPQWAIEAHLGAWTEPGNIVTSGPYMLTEWIHGDHLTFVKNPDWYDANQVQIEVINGLIVTDAHTALTMYEDDRLDYLGDPGLGVPLDQVDRIKADPVLSRELYIAPRLCTYYYGFSTDKPPFDNPLVRRAFSAAINRQGLIDNVTKGEQRPANAFACPGIFGNVAGDPDIAPWALDYEQGKTLAQQWLAQAGYPNGEGFPEVTLMYNTSGAHRAIAEYIAANWTDVLSVTVHITDMEWTEYLRLINQCPSPWDKPHIWRSGFCVDYPDQNNWVYENFHSEYGSNNICWYNEEFDNVTSEAGAEADPARRRELYKRAEEILNGEEAGIAPIYYYTRVALVKPYMELVFAPMGGDHVYKWRKIFKSYLPVVTKNYPAARVGLVVAGVVNDGSFNQTAWKGVQDAMARLGVAGRYLESPSSADYEPNINEFVRQDYDLIITVGYLLGDATKAAAEANPNQKFTIVDYVYDPLLPNVLGQTYASDEAAFLAGYLAGGMSRTGKVATFGAIDIPSITIFMVGYEAGVNYYNQVHGTNVEVLGTDFYIGSFGIDDGRTAAESLFDQGADILLPVAGPAGIGSAEVAQERGLMLIGVDTDWYISVPEFKETYLTSVLKKMDMAIFDAIEAVIDGTFEGGTYVGTLANDGVGIAPFHDFEDEVPEELEAELEDVKQGIIDGTIDTGWPK